MREYRFFKTRLVNKTLWVELHNPPVNFLSADICKELYMLIKEVERDPGIRVFILTGGIEDTYIFHFSIPELARIANDNRKILIDRVYGNRFSAFLMQYFFTFTMLMMDKFQWYERLILALSRIMRPYVQNLFLIFYMHRAYFAIERMGKITIAAINGNCSGGGTEMGACFDFRFMIDDQGFTISQPEIGIGIEPCGGGNSRLPRLIGKAKALEFMLTAALWSPEEAKRNSLITDHFPKKKFHARVQKFADDMVLRIPVAVREIKRTVNDGMNSGLVHSLSIEMGGAIRCFSDKYTQNAIREYMKIIRERILEPAGKRGTIADSAELMRSDEVVRRVYEE